MKEKRSEEVKTMEERNGSTALLEEVEELVPFIPIKGIIKEPIEFVKGLFIFPKGSLDAWSILLGALDDNYYITKLHRGDIEKFLSEIEGEKQGIKQRSLYLIKRIKDYIGRKYKRKEEMDGTMEEWK